MTDTRDRDLAPRLDRRQLLRKAGALVALGMPATTAVQPRGLDVRDRGVEGIEIRDGHGPVLCYRYATVPRPASLDSGLTDAQRESLRRYGHPRSNYIHPLHGLDGVPLTDDWSKDHPHHRGIYWAWPEVGHRGEVGDLHALQRVFARPTGRIVTVPGDEHATIEAENEWRWDDVTPIVRETVRLRAHRRASHGRLIDVHCTLMPLVTGVTLARRQTTLYGGLNTRLAPVAGLTLTHHADAAGVVPRMAWQRAAGTWHGASRASSLTIFERAENLHYPGDYVEYPDLPWFQPAFPRAGLRHVLDAPLVLRYRLWIHDGPTPGTELTRAMWQAFQQESDRR